MCATVCPSQALFFGTREELAAARPRSLPVNEFQFGQQIIRTKVAMLMPVAVPVPRVDVTARAPEEQPAAGFDPLLDALFDETEVTCEI
jgi:hypothetical protein